MEFPDQKIIETIIEKEVRKSFLEYSMSVIVDRALPDVRDGLKPVHRRILYSMYEKNYTSDKPTVKSAKVVGDVLGSYHPHGDTSVYDAMVRLAQPFSLRYPLVFGQGNFGNVDGDGAAAYRYTEARLEKLANEMLADIDKDVIDFTPNFDNTLKEPTVLPSRFPNILVNGSVGIAVGMATNIPPHNMTEVINGTVYLIDNPDASVDELMQFVKGPDFPTYATIHGTSGIKRAYMTGKGKISVRAKCEIIENKHRIEVYEIPYQVNKAMLVASIAELVKSKRIEGITALRDESDRKGMKIVIEYRRDVNPNVLLNQLYRYTQLQDTCAINMLMLVNGEPKVLGLKEILSSYIRYQEEIIRRRTSFELDRAKKRAHILEGLKIAILNIDEVIRIIRASKSIPDAKEGLMNAFGLDDIQAQAIVEMQLGRLSNLETIKIEEELDRMIARIEELEGILADESKVLEIIKTELIAIRDKFGDERRTAIEEDEDEIIDEDLIERGVCVITMTHDGYFKRRPLSEYNAQRRGGKGNRATATKDEDFVERVVVSGTHDHVMFFTNTGKVFVKKAYNITEAGANAKGTNVVNMLEVEKDEKITAFFPVTDFEHEGYLFMVTKNGTVKKTPLSEFEYQRKTGKRALSLDEGNELLSVHLTDGEDRIIVATKSGRCVCFEEHNVRSMGRTAAGVRGIRLADGDEVCGSAVVDNEKMLVSVTENGFGKRTPFEEYTVHGRGGSGMKCHNVTEKTGLLAGIAAVSEDDDVLLISDGGTMIRFNAEQIRITGRPAAGVRVMTPKDGEHIVNLACVEREEEKETETDEESR
ncbi:MAG: DNA gyrase subunit A [Clostridia bacterium]|nr:DNA gyrase subunit A [Clostridia bacterium]